MLDTSQVLNYLKDNGKSTFDQIWSNVFMDEINNFQEDINFLKSKFYLSIIRDFRFIRVENSQWDLKEKYTLDQIETFQNQYYDNINIIEENDLDGNEITEETESAEHSISLEEEDSIENSIFFDDEDPETLIED